MIEEQFVLFNVSGTTQREVVGVLVNHAKMAGRITSVAEVVDAVLRREVEGTTGFGKGIAIPHGKCNAVSEPTLLFARLQNKVEWKAMDDQPVQALFMILVPEKSHNDHLKILAQLARKLMHDDFVEGLLSITSQSQMVVFLTEQLA